MAFASVGDFVEELKRSRLLTPAQHDEITRMLLPRISEPAGLAKELMRKGWLTVYQVNQLFQKAGQQLIVGPYRILDQLGKGGVSQVFKAYHEQHKCLVALKVIHTEMASNAEAYGRFQREMRIVSHLNHPNIVKAFDDGQALGNTHFYAMEFVEGTDLYKLVQLTGPMAIDHACDCIRQAALGLQHAHEKDLVHRDIKPANLVLIKAPGSQGAGMVKILDLGLARARQPQSPPGQFEVQTVKGVMIGTPDYVSPEQARDPTAVDIRADIYSLGCTLYYLLAGQPPFPGISALEKIFKHASKQAPDVSIARKEVPPELAAIVARMLAKKPDDRIQTPAEVVTALEPFCKKQ